MSLGLARQLLLAAEVPRTRANAARAWQSISGGLPLALSFEVPGLGLEDFVRIYDAVRPLRLTLAGEALLHPELSAVLAHARAAVSTLETDGARLTPGVAFALVQAAPAWLRVRIDGGEPTLRNVEKLVAMRDANRRPGPGVQLAVADAAGLLPAIELCARRFRAIEPVYTGTDPTGLGEARARAASRGFRYTVASIDTLSVAPTACRLPWLSAHVSATGDVYPCHAHAAAGTPVGNALRSPFAEVWEGAPMRGFRAALRVERRGDPICAGCARDDGPLARLVGG